MSTEEQKAVARENWRYHCRRAKLLHKCAKCSADLEPKPDGSYKVLCPKCYTKNLTLTKKRQAKRKAEHRCIQCGKPLDDFNPRTGGYYSRCTVCRAKSRACKEKTQK